MTKCHFLRTWHNSWNVSLFWKLVDQLCKGERGKNKSLIRVLHSLHSNPGEYLTRWGHTKGNYLNLIWNRLKDISAHEIYKRCGSSIEKRVRWSSRKHWLSYHGDSIPTHPPTPTQPPISRVKLCTLHFWWISAGSASRWKTSKENVEINWEEWYLVGRNDYLAPSVNILWAYYDTR